jgi:hypothetical protein
MDSEEAIRLSTEYVENFNYCAEYCNSGLVKAFDLYVTVGDSVSRSFINYFTRTALKYKSDDFVKLETSNDQIKKLFVALAVVNRFHVAVRGFTEIPDKIIYLPLRHLDHPTSLAIGCMKTQMLFLRMN